MIAERLGVLGGTFDPIHAGHLDAAAAARAALDLDRIVLLPSATPPHRDVAPQASVFHRFALVAIAALTDGGLRASDLELRSGGVSYTSGTLRRLHAAGAAPLQLFFITGADAFAEIATWYDYPAVLDLAHFVVISRPGHAAHALPEALPELAGRMRIVTPGQHAPAPDSAAIFLVDTATRDVSSTEIRRRRAAGAAIEDLVPPDVARYIAQHGLYRGTQATAERLHD